MDNLPLYVSFVFGLTVLIALFLFYRATRSSAPFLIVVLIWITLQSVLSLSGFYRGAHPGPPRLSLLMLPPLLMIAVLFSTRRGRDFIDGLDLKTLTLFHTIRVPVEVVLFWLFAHKAVPILMTFEGRNFDILSGLSAPLIYYYGFVYHGFVKTRWRNSMLIGWNLVCLALVLNVVTYALLSAPTPFQRFAFEQPNIAIQYFPFVLLPSVLVPLVLLAHFATIRRLLLFSTNLTTPVALNQED